MNKKLKILLSVMAMGFVMAGCGGGSDSGSAVETIPPVDNSILTDEQNEYGYYGADVIFGRSLVVGSWTNKAIYQGVSETVEMGMFDEGTILLKNITRDILLYGIYGVSADGRILKTSLGDTVTIQNSIGNDCYEVLLTNINKEGSLSAEVCRTKGIEY